MLILKSATSDWSVDSAPAAETAGSYLRSHKTTFTFIAHKGFQAQILAYMLDSLVRVSRRVNENHFIRISNAASTSSFPVTSTTDRTTLLSKPVIPARVREAIT